MRFSQLSGRCEVQSATRGPGGAPSTPIPDAIDDGARERASAIIYQCKPVINSSYTTITDHTLVFRLASPIESVAVWMCGQRRTDLS